MSLGKVNALKIYTLSEDYTGYDSPFWASFGISFLLQIDAGEGKKNILFDTASDSEPVLHNMELLQISPSDIDVIVLSHSHFDHTGGLAGILKAMDKEDVPIIAHPEIFTMSISPSPYLERYRSRIYLNQGLSGKNRKENIESLGGVWYLVGDPIGLMTGVITTGEIKKEEKVDYEKEPYINLLDLRDGKLVSSTIRDDISLCVNTSKGLVIITGCSHAGIVSIAKKAVNVTDVKDLEGIVGGFHLVDATNDAIDSTIKDLKNLKVRKIYSGHCTGIEAEYRLRKTFSEDFERLCSGKVMIF